MLSAWAYNRPLTVHHDPQIRYSILMRIITSVLPHLPPDPVHVFKVPREQLQ